MLYKIRHYFKNVISRLSIRQKMLIALITCIIIPMILLGLYTALRIIDLSAQNQYEAQISQLTKSAKELENLYTMVEQEAQSLAYDSSVQAIAEGSASVIDYRTASEHMTSASEKIDYCNCIAVIRDGEILFQRGEQYLSEASPSDEQQTQPLSKWESASNIFFEKGIHSFLLDEITYETTILQDMTYNKQGTVRIYLDVSQILEAIAPTGAEGETAIQNVLVCTPDGKILFEKETESRDGEQLSIFWKARTDSIVQAIFLSQRQASKWFCTQDVKPEDGISSRQWTNWISMIHSFFISWASCSFVLYLASSME